jgi:hypothetical protein
MVKKPSNPPPRGRRRSLLDVAALAADQRCVEGRQRPAGFALATRKSQPVRLAAGHSLRYDHTLGMVGEPGVGN